MTTKTIENMAFLQTCESMFGSEIIALFEGSNYLRMSDFAYAHHNHYVLLLSTISRITLDKARVLLSDFPTYYVHFLSELEFSQYPNHGLWQFYFRQPVIGKNPFSAKQLTTEQVFDGIKHSIIQIAHFTRKHYLSADNVWNSTWAIRWAPWILELLDYGVIRLYHYIDSNQYPMEINELISYKYPDALIEIIEKLQFYKTKWNNEREIFLYDSESLMELLIFLNDAIEQYLDLLITHPMFIIESKKIEPKNNIFQDDNIYEQFAHALSDELKDELLLLQLSGSQARGEATQNSDVDTITVIKNIDTNTLLRIKSSLLKFPGFSSYVLSKNGFYAYPPYRDYTFRYGCQKLFGELIWNNTVNIADIRDGVRHTVITIAQVAREYYLRGGYPMRSIASLRWQAKIADFGCLRLFPLLYGGDYLDTRHLVVDYFKENNTVQTILDLLNNPDEWRKTCRQELLTGERKSIDQRLLLINQFALEILTKLNLGG